MTSDRTNAWDFLTAGLWTLFFAAGLVPEPVFHIFRALSSVPAHRAFVNSSAVITVGFAVYFAYFVRSKCREGGLSRVESQGNAIQIGLIALIAFLEIPGRGDGFDSRTFIVFLINFRDISDPYVRNVVIFIGVLKISAWWYLFSLVLRYHLLGNRLVFAHMFPFIPSTRAAAVEREETPVEPVKPERTEALERSLDTKDWQEESSPK